MDALAVAVAGVVTLAAAGISNYWRWRAVRAEADTRLLRSELAEERHAACHDPLTGLPNRRAFQRFGTEALGAAAGGPLVVVVVDLDDFKQINDDHGHAAGDEVLITVARRLTGYAGTGLVARLGGDEFVGLLAAAPAEGTRLAELLAAPMAVAGRTLVVTASVGVAAVDDPGDLAEAIRRADAAMYRAKNRRRAPLRHRASLTNHGRMSSYARALDDNFAG